MFPIDNEFQLISAASRVELINTQLVGTLNMVRRSKVQMRTLVDETDPRRDGLEKYMDNYLADMRRKYGEVLEKTIDLNG